MLRAAAAVWCRIDAMHSSAQSSPPRSHMQIALSVSLLLYQSIICDMSLLIVVIHPPLAHTASATYAESLHHRCTRTLRPNSPAAARALPRFDVSTYGLRYSVQKL